MLLADLAGGSVRRVLIVVALWLALLGASVALAVLVDRWAAGLLAGCLATAGVLFFLVDDGRSDVKLSNGVAQR